MYFHVKVIFLSILLLVSGSFLYLFRGYLPDLTLFNKKPEILKKSESNLRSKKTTVGNFDVKKRGQIPKTRGNNVAFEKKFNRAKELFNNRELISARKITENILLNPNLDIYGEDWVKAAELLGQINTLFLFTDAICPEKESYSVAKGDNLIKIANQFNTTVSLIQKSNILDATNPNIFPNQVFKIYKGNWNIKVIKSHFLLLLMDEDKITKVYKVGTGRQDRTPIGTFVIDVKEFEPDWWKPGKLVPFGDTENVLGTRWLGLSPINGTSASLKGYGIHGTWEPQSIGHAASQGCVRMVNENVEELFDIVPPMTRVVIVD